MKKILTLLFTLPIFYAQGQNQWDAAKIPANLKSNAVAVVRQEEAFLDIKNTNSAQYQYKFVATILSKAGDEIANFQEVYDKFSTLNNVKAAIYDATGKKIKEFKSSDVKDQSLTSDFSIFDDNRMKYLKLVHLTYPYTIEYSYQQDFKGLLYFPQWRNQSGFGISVENTSYTIQKEIGYHVKLKTSKGLSTDSSIVGNKTKYTWKSSQLPALEYEYLNNGIDNITAWVKASPTTFNYDGSSGNFNNWNNFGHWLNTLNEGGNNLPDNFKTKLKDLVKNVQSNEDKIKILYEYLQQNTRYVSVQLGVGGFRPILAEKVATVNYGDCKALSNFMKAMLNEVGIPSYLIMIGNNKPSLDETYASIGQANHMILMVPDGDKHKYLECTSQHYPMGYIGYGNADKKVLKISDKGGELIHTPAYSAADNFQKRKAEISFINEKLAKVKIFSKYGSAQYEDRLSLLLAEPTEQKKYILNNSTIPVAEFIDFKIEQKDKYKPEIVEELNITGQQLLTKGGENLFLVLNQINKKDYVPQKIENRKTNFAISYNYNDEDEIEFNLPEGYKVDFLPENIELNSEFGTYSAKFSKAGNKIIYHRTQLMNKKVFPPEKYNDYVEYIKKIVQADKLKAVLIKA